MTNRLRFRSPSFALLWLSILILSLYECKSPSIPVPQNTTPTRDDNMAMGNPDGVKRKQPQRLLITRPAYSL
ncbi:hypothetical protein G8759_06230 [Spirosoma aureum]|uniref:Uncharacterized protein n=1 Tax=Spirosoma aureum TaxID=2692134 RepID=A0A6G9AJ96_9BACT|nr:hypothetical protein [Spirosoma aureum]QIP12253.1 hypothetical protein G8759_06230 [Spirosoma aureum]